VDTSKFKGYEDKYLVGGGYWPPQYSIMDGDTLKPLKIVSTRGMTVDGEYHPEPRVASIVASHIKPEWVVNIKETGMILLVDYSDINNLKTTTINSAKFLHDGGWDAPSVTSWSRPTPRTRSPRSTPRPASWPRWSTPRRSPTRVAAPTSSIRSSVPSGQPGHLGDAVITLISTPSDDPKEHAKYKQYNWKVVQELKTPARATCSSRRIRSPRICGPTCR
jgi:nitrite reductase (NO-forming)/hydroxylamine reductase